MWPCTHIKHRPNGGGGVERLRKSVFLERRSFAEVEPIKKGLEQLDKSITRTGKRPCVRMVLFAYSVNLFVSSTLFIGKMDKYFRLTTVC